MPRFAFALRRPPADVDVLRTAARSLLGDQAPAHKAFLLERGIVRERVWSQSGAGSPPLVTVLWDCDDVEEATRLEGVTAHERWLLRLLGDPGEPPRRPELLSGTTVRPTDAGSAQTLTAVPLAEGSETVVRAVVARLEDGDLADAHRSLLVRAGIREEWIWHQPAGAGLPPLVLLHWIVDDPSTAWQVVAEDDDPAAAVLREEVLGRGPVPPEVIADWDVEQLLAMHVRRSDSGDPPAGRLASRLQLGLSRGRWDALARACQPAVTSGGAQVPAAVAVDRIRDVVGDDGCPVVDVLVGSHHVLCLLRRPGDPTTAVLATVRGGLVDELAVLPGWPSAGVPA